MFLTLIVGLLMGAMVIIFAAQNLEVVSVTFLTWQFEGSLALILVVAVAVGMIISSLLSIPIRLYRRSQVSRLKTDNEILQEELERKSIEVKEEKNKVAARNAYLDELENGSRSHL
jgi:lipopolysaccharide assembly protein A